MKPESETETNSDSKLPSERELQITTSDDFKNERLYPAETIITIPKKKSKCFEKLDNTQKLMMTPCIHFFHPDCLKLWIENKSECPVCRAILPMLDE
jgi:hypothetical protein